MISSLHSLTPASASASPSPAGAETTFLENPSSPVMETLDVESESRAPEPVASESTDPEEANLGLGFCINSEASPFAVGDLVWAKTKTQPWWPAKVSDPSRAPELPRRADAGVLVAFFGTDTLVWCELSQLKPFVPDFSHMARQSAAKSFAGAVEAALEEIVSRLESQMACGCADEASQARGDGCLDSLFPMTNYTAIEFVERLRDVAEDVTIVDALEATRLRSWVLAFARGRGWSDDPTVYHQRRRIADLVDKIDLDHPPGELIGEDSGGRNPHHRAKRRSMAKLIAEMDLNSVEIDDGDEEKTELVEDEREKKEKKNEKKEEDVKVQNVEAEEATGSGKRERKKSKYLSPPYTDLVGFGKHLIPDRDEDIGALEKFMEPSQAIVIQKEDDQKSLVYKIESMSANEILLEFLAAALDPLHLKWNRLARIVRGFFAMYRSSVYSNGTDFEDYQKHLSDAGCCVNEKVSDKAAVADRLEDGNSEGKGKISKDAVKEGTPRDTGFNMLGSSGQGKSLQKRKGRKVGADAHTPTKKVCSVASQRTNSSKDANGTGIPLDLGQVVPEHRLTGLKRKMRKAGSDSGDPVPLSVEIINGSAEGKSKGRGIRKSKIGVNGGTMVDLSGGFMASAQGKTDYCNVVTNGKVLLEVASEFTGNCGAGKSARKRRKHGTPTIDEAVVDMDRETTNCSGKGKSRRKKKEKNESNVRSQAALLLTFSSDFALPSKDMLLSTFSNYGTLVESETELLKDSHSACVVFATTADAEKAFNDRDRNVAFKPPAVNYRLRYLPAPGNLSSSQVQLPIAKPPLPYLRKNLERMISTLSGISPQVKDAGSSDGLKPEARENLVDEMQGLLKKVNKLLTGPPAGSGSSS